MCVCQGLLILRNTNRGEETSSLLVAMLDRVFRIGYRAAFFAVSDIAIVGAVSHLPNWQYQPLDLEWVGATVQ